MKILAVEYIDLISSWTHRIAHLRICPVKKEIPNDITAFQTCGDLVNPNENGSGGLQIYSRRVSKMELVERRVFAWNSEISLSPKIKFLALKYADFISSRNRRATKISLNASEYNQKNDSRAPIHIISSKKKKFWTLKSFTRRHQRECFALKTAI